MTTARPGDTVTVQYTICLENGALLRPLHSSDTLRFTLGRDAVLPGFERAVQEMSVGERRRVKVAAAEAYGPHRPDKLFTVSRADLLPGLEPLSAGDVVRVVSALEGEFFAIIRELTSSEILLDANHPLCGQDVTFEIQLLEVSAPGSVPSAAPGRNGRVHAASEG